MERVRAAAEPAVKAMTRLRFRHQSRLRDRALLVLAFAGTFRRSDSELS